MLKMMVILFYIPILPILINSIIDATPNYKTIENFKKSLSKCKCRVCVENRQKGYPELH